jgi:hypothetical protein
MAEDRGFEPLMGFPKPAFQASAIGQLGESSADEGTNRHGALRPLRPPGTGRLTS